MACLAVWLLPGYLEAAALAQVLLRRYPRGAHAVRECVPAARRPGGRSQLGVPRGPEALPPGAASTYALALHKDSKRV